MRTLLITGIVFLALASIVSQYHDETMSTEKFDRATCVFTAISCVAWVILLTNLFIQEKLPKNLVRFVCFPFSYWFMLIFTEAIGRGWKDAISTYNQKIFFDTVKACFTEVANVVRFLISITSGKPYSPSYNWPMLILGVFTTCSLLTVSIIVFRFVWKHREIERKNDATIRLAA